MAHTQTPHIALLLPDLGDGFNFGAHVEANFTQIDAMMGAVNALSTSRPGTTYNGQIVYEADSKRYVQQIGTSAAPSWQYMSHQALVGTSSSRPTSGLTAGLIMYETDTGVERPYTGSAWGGTNASFASSGLPTHAVVGDMAYTTDAGAEVVYTGSIWKFSSNATCTSSTRPVSALVAGVTAWETDANREIIYTGSAWQQLNSVTCTSSAHPANPITGGVIYESDTGLTAIYNGSSYYYPPQKITAVTLAASATTIVLSSIPQSFTNLRLIMRLKSQSTATSHIADNVYLQFNGVTSASYNTGGVFNTNAGSVTSAIGSGLSFLELGAIWTSFPTSTAGAGNSVTDINNYTDTLFAKAAQHVSYASDGGSAFDFHAVGGSFSATVSTAAITSITIGTTSGSGLAIGSTVEVIGF